MMTRKFTIYCHTNTVNGKSYVGQTVDSMEGRWREHLSAAKQNRGARLLGQAIRKYGPGAFRHEVLEVVSTQAEADLAEVKWIRLKDSRAPHGYNLALGGNGAGYHHDDSKRLIGEASRLRLRAMTPTERSTYFATNIHRWTPERRVKARELARSTAMREKVSAGQVDFWAKLSPEEKTERVKHQLAGMTVEQKGNRVRKAWANLTPEARAERVRRARAANVAADATRSRKMSEWQTAQAKLRTPEQRSAIVKKAWETRRRREAVRETAA